LSCKCHLKSRGVLLLVFWINLVCLIRLCSRKHNTAICTCLRKGTFTIEIERRCAARSFHSSACFLLCGVLVRVTQSCIVSLVVIFDPCRHSRACVLHFMPPSCVCMRAHSASRTPAAHLRANAFFLGEWQFSTHCQENVAIAAYHNSLHHVKFGVCKMQNFPNRGAPKTCQVPMYTI
jgi:hypothetical protein